jgi:hypothetical protein
VKVTRCILGSGIGVLIDSAIFAAHFWHFGGLAILSVIGLQEKAPANSWSLVVALLLRQRIY